MKHALILASALSMLPLVAHAQSSMQGAYVNAPVTAPLTKPMSSNAGCGLFETCANTKIGLGRGDFLIRASAIGVLPEDMSSSVGVIGGRVKATNQVMPELTFEYFFSDHISLDLIAASTRHELAAEGTALGHVDVGSTWVLPPTLTLAWHFRPHKRFNPYIGAGMTLAFFYNMQPAGGAVNKLDLRTTVGPAADIGFDYQLAGNWFLNVDAKQMFLSVPGRLNDGATNGVAAPSGPSIHVRDSLNPTVVGMGIGYRF